MPEPMGRIRSFQPSDDKEVRFIIGQANMEPLAVANQRGQFVIPVLYDTKIELSFFLFQSAYIHPLTVCAWFILSCLFIEYMHWWPNVQEHGWIAYLRPLPAFASVAVPILALVDWSVLSSYERQQLMCIQQE
jgi:hypothetical protein